MFLTTGEKIRQIRQQFHLKQGVFQHFGITQHYLSMIETNKRQAPRGTLEDIYSALMTLTEEKIAELYTLEEFLLSPEQQAKLWVEIQLEKGIIENEIINIIKIAKKYQLYEELLSIDRKLGVYYYEKKDYTLAVQYFHYAILRCLQLNLNPYSIYAQYGRILRSIGRYDESISNLFLAMEYAEDEEQLNNAKILLGVTYYRMGKNELTLEIIDEFLDLNANVNPQFIVGARVMKEGILRRESCLQEGRDLLIPMLEDPKFKDAIQYVYHSLGWNYIDAGLYEEALDILQQTLPLRVSHFEKSLTKLLIGSIYVEIDDYQTAQEFFTEVKDIIINSNSIDSKMLWFERQLDLYWKYDQFDNIESLMNEIKILVDQNHFPEWLFVELRNNLYKRVAPHIAINNNEYAFFYNFLII